jgi:DNA repair exonuclease SbcCD nuclease subunit
MKREKMSKIAIISDTHYGIRGDNSVIMDNTKLFLDNVFFPLIQSKKIDIVIHLGDLVDKRKNINYLTLKRMKDDFLNPLQNNLKEIYFIAGNHDCVYKNTNDLNALTELLGAFTNFKWFTSAKEIELYNEKILLVPWITDSNREFSMQAIKTSKSRICMGHLQITGFEMYRGSVATHGDDRKLFEKFGTTLSGHFHHRSSDGLITYVGSHSQFTWADYGDSRGFHIFDLETQELEFVENPYTLFSKVWYDDKDKKLIELLQVDPKAFSNKYVKIIVTNKTNPYWFDMYCETVEKLNPLAVQIVEDHHNAVDLEDDELVSEAESTVDIFKKYVAQMPDEGYNKQELETLLVDLYNQSQATMVD